jgi:hypothetical protein
MYSKQLDIESILKSVHKYIKQITVIIIICFLFSCLASTFITNKYSASLVVAPALHDLKAKDKQKEEDDSEITTDFDKFLYLLTSNNVAKELAKDTNVNKRIKPSMSLSSFILYGKLKNSNKVEAIQKYLNDNVSIIDIKDSGMKKIILKHANDEFAKQLLAKIYLQADALIKAKETEKNEKEIIFIQDSLQKDSLSGNREMFIQLLQHQLQIKSMLSVDLPYSADVVEEINVSSNPSSPSILLIVLLTTVLLSGMFSFLLIYTKENK